MSIFTTETLKIFLGKELEKAEQYKKNLVKFTPIQPSNSHKKKFLLQLINKTNSIQTYKIDDILLSERFSTSNIFYPLSNNEILSVLHYYEIFKLEIEILHYKLINVQAFTNGKNLTLKIPSDLTKNRTNKGFRAEALFTLLHEISHILGNISLLPTCESEADRFAAQELLKWEKIIDLKE